MSQGFEPVTGAPRPSSGVGKIVLITLAVLSGLGLICCGGFAMFSWWAMGQGAKQIVSPFKSNPDVVNEIGSIDSASFNFMETQKETEKNPDKPVLVIDVKGSKDSAKIILELEPGKPQQNGDFKAAKLRLKDGREIELVEADPDFEGPSKSLPDSSSENSAVEVGNKDL